MSKPSARWPSWSGNALQGLAFWIGHRHALYSNYPLGESALVAEACNLIYAHLGHGETLLCEQKYTRLMPDAAWPNEQGSKPRADLAIVKGLTHSQAKKLASLSGHLSAVIEVKRASSPRSQIDNDLKRLAIFKNANPDVRALLFVVAESHRPKRFVTHEGVALRGKHDIHEHDAHYRVRRVCKAAASFSGKEKAHYACIIEVFSGAQP